MKPAFIGFAIMWILVTFVTSFRMLVNAQVIFMILLVPPVLILLYGLLAEAPVPATATETGKTPLRWDVTSSLFPSSVARHRNTNHQNRHV